MNLIQILDATCTCMGNVKIPQRIFDIVHTIIVIMKFGIPLLLIIFGMLDLGKSVVASKEDEIKKGQKTFISRLIAAVIVFFVVVIVQLVVNIADENSGDDINGCLNAFVNGVECHGQEVKNEK